MKPFPFRRRQLCRQRDSTFGFCQSQTRHLFSFSSKNVFKETDVIRNLSCHADKPFLYKTYLEYEVAQGRGVKSMVLKRQNRVLLSHINKSTKFWQYTQLITPGLLPELLGGKTCLLSKKTSEMGARLKPADLGDLGHRKVAGFQQLTRFFQPQVL